MNSSNTNPNGDSRPAVIVVTVGTDGAARQESWTPASDGGLLEQLQGAVGGLVDVVALGDRLDMWTHDEGLYVCDANPVATLLAFAFGRNTQPYFGPVVFTGGADADGTTRSLDSWFAAGLLKAAQAAADDTTRLASVTARSEQFAAAYR